MSEKRVKVEREVAEREIKVVRENVVSVYATGIFPSGALNITENGEYDVTAVKTAKVNIPCLTDEDIFASVLTNRDLRYLLKRVVVHEKSASVTTFGFANMTNLEYVDLSGMDVTNLLSFQSMFSGCTNLAYVNISGWVRRPGGPTTVLMFQNCTNLRTLIIDGQEGFYLSSVNALEGTAIAMGTGYVYVPDNLVDTYKTHEVWSSYANQIKPLSELPA